MDKSMQQMALSLLMVFTLVGCDSCGADDRVTESRADAGAPMGPGGHPSLGPDSGTQPRVLTTGDGAGVPTCSPPPSTAWSFGVMGDSQWDVPDDGKNPNTVSVGIINQLNQEFSRHHVKFVVAVGDLSDSGSVVGLDTRATYAQALYNAGIGFYPLRGNHDGESSTGTATAVEFPRVFPQTQSGINNNTPADARVKTADDGNTHLVTNTGVLFTVGTGFSSPSDKLKGLSYAFEFQNGRFVVLDQFRLADASANSIEAQQPWISARLAGAKAAGVHAFVFGHKGLITEHHVDSLFGDNPSMNPAAQDAFISSLAANGVRYYIGGHDHMHDRTIVSTTDGVRAKLTQIISAGASSKFYTPNRPSVDEAYNRPPPPKGLGHSRQIPLSQDLGSVGYYIYTVDGPQVTVDYYGADAGAVAGVILRTPTLSFYRRETFGYSHNGKEFIIPPGGSYASVQDSFANTAARILSGKDVAKAHDGSGRPFSHLVDTGWSPRTCATVSDVLRLWGMASGMGSDQSAAYTLSVRYDPASVTDAQAASGALGLAAKDSDGSWVNAVAKNVGGSKNFILGPWRQSYSLGSFGIDKTTHTAWAIINYSNTLFAVAPFAH